MTQTGDDEVLGQYLDAFGNQNKEDSLVLDYGRFLV